MLDGSSFRWNCVSLRSVSVGIVRSQLVLTQSV